MIAESISSLIDRVNIGPLERDFQGNSTDIENFFWGLQKHVIGGLNEGDMITDINIEKEARRLASDFIFTFFRINESVQDRLMGYPGVTRSKLESEREKLTSYRNELIQGYSSLSNQTLKLLFGLREPLLVEKQCSLKLSELAEFAHLEYQPLHLFFETHMDKHPENGVFTLPISLKRNIIISLHKLFKQAAKNYFNLHLIDDFLKPFKLNPHVPFIKTSEYLQKKEDRRQIHLSKLDFV